MTDEQIRECATNAPVYRFGSEELEAIHARRDAQGRYTEHQVYVVYHPPVNGGPEHWTLNITLIGQVVPAIYDIR